jgi:hypothetical protein
LLCNKQKNVLIKNHNLFCAFRCCILAYMACTPIS